MIGDSWVDLGIPVSGIVAIFDLVYLGNGILLGGGEKSGAANRLIKSTNLGENWTDKGEIAHASCTQLESFCNRGSGRVFAGFGGGSGADAQIWESTDWGESWTLRFDTAYYYFICIEYCGGDVMCAGAQACPFMEIVERLARSVNDGVNWTGFGITPDASQICCLLYPGGDILLAGTAKGGGPAKICRSTNKGAEPSWSDVFTDASLTSVGCLAEGAEGVIVTGVNKHIYRSTDVGLNWNDQGEPADGAVTDIAYFGNNIFLGVTGNGHAIRSTDNGLTWSDLGKITTGESEVLRCLVSVSSSLCYAGTSEGHLLKTEEEAPPQEVFGGYIG